jgi:hypothetical protein
MSLQSQLTEAFKLALKKRSQVQQLPLKGGLDIWLYVDEAGVNHVQFRRRTPAWPSDREVETVLNLWPQPNTPKLEKLEVSKAAAAFNCVSLKWKPARPEMAGG